MLLKITFDVTSDSNIKFNVCFVWQKDLLRWLVIAVEMLCAGK